MTTIAEDHIANPNDEMTKVADEMKRLSAASQSEARATLTFEDGSAIDFISREGGDATIEAIAPSEEEQRVEGDV